MPESYKIGLEIAVSSTGAQALGAIGRELSGLGRQAKALESDLGSVRIAAIGAMAVIGGTAILRGLGDAVKHGSELMRQQNRMKQAGMSQVEIAAATREAWLLTYTAMNRGVTENLALIQGLRNMIGSMPGASELAPTAAKLETVRSSITGRSGEGPGADFFRFLQLQGSLVNRQTGQIDLADAARWRKIGEAIVSATHGLHTDVTPRDLKMSRIQAGMAGSASDEVGLIELAPLIGHMKGGAGGDYHSRIGADLFHLLEQFVDPTGQNGAQELISRGLLNKHKVQIRRGGQVVLERGALKDQKLPETRFIEWVDNVLSPALKRVGAKTLQDQAPMTTHLKLSATAAHVLQAALRTSPEPRIEAADAFKAAGIDQYPVAETTPNTAIEAFRKAWDTVLTALGSPLVNNATGALGKIGTGINDFVSVLATHPNVTELLAADVGAMSLIGGTVAIISDAAGALGLFAAASAAASGLGALGGASLVGFARAAVLFAPGATAAIGLGAASSGLSVLGAVLSGFAGPPAFLLAMKPTLLNSGEQRQFQELFPNLPRGIPAPPGAKSGLVLASDKRPQAAPTPTAPRPSPSSSDFTSPGPVHNESSLTNGTPLHVTLINSVTMDGQEIAHIVSQHMARAATLPPASGTGYDPSMTPTYPSGLIGNA